MYPQFQHEQLSQNIIKLRQFDDILRQLFGLELRIQVWTLLEPASNVLITGKVSIFFRGPR